MSIQNFTAYNPTRLHFGNGVIEKLGRRSSMYGSKALLITGKGSVKKYGYLERSNKGSLSSIVHDLSTV